MVRPETISSPAEQSSSSVELMAAMPEAITWADSPASIRASAAASARVGRIPVARVEEAALDLVVEDLLHPLDAHEGVGRRVADRRVHVAELAEDQEVLDLGGGIECHKGLPGARGMAAECGQDAPEKSAPDGRPASMRQMA